MVRVVSQETYDDIVRENMKEFDMPLQEAIEEAIQQLEAQGVDLTNIIKEFTMSETEDSCHVLKDTVILLKQLTKRKKTDDEAEEMTPLEKYELKQNILGQLDIIKSECDKDLAHRMYAEKQGLYTVLIGMMESLEEDENKMALKLAQTILSFMTGQPDPLEKRGVGVMLSFLDDRKDPLLQKLVLRWIKECCTKHERNRQAIFNAGILDHLKPMLHEPSSQMLKEICGVLRSLVLDDDIRVEFGRAHEHARVIATDTICQIITLMKTYQKEEALVAELMLTLASLLVRNEFCMKVDLAGGVKFILEALIDFHESEKLNRQGLKLLKALAGNDDCKMNIIKHGAAPIIASALEMHKGADALAIAGLGAIAALALRIPENSEALYKAGIPDVIIDIMRAHPNDENIQRQASFAIRNMVSRSKHQCPHFLTLGAEHELNKALSKFPNCEYDLKSALRDLGCHVNLTEQWTGKGGKIHSDHNVHKE